MIDKHIDVNLCYGCDSCVQICPKKCIELRANEFGMSYPYVDQRKCIKCGQCLLVCPSINSEIKKDNSTQKYYAFKNSKKVITKSASGGAFTAICYEFIKDVQKYCIWGAVIEKNTLNTEIREIQNIDEIYLFNKSKYVECSTVGVYSKVKNRLENGYKVVYSGTPCQIAGLRLFLKKNYSNLLCIDLICHGVPTNLVFKKYVANLESVENKEVSEYTFRSKDKFFNKVDPYSVRIKFNDGMIKSIPKYKDKYMVTFLNGALNRDSCYNCNYSTFNRVGDITLGDFWGIENYNADLKSNEGVSLVVTNTRKGQSVIEEFFNNRNYYLSEVTKNQVVSLNSHLTKKLNKPDSRERFYSLLKENDFYNSAISTQRFYSTFRIIISQIYHKYFRKN
jgi:coenzyme F420-reducing hydrogenase beta subunit